jgi:hypothetical protein
MCDGVVELVEDGLYAGGCEGEGALAAIGDAGFGRHSGGLDA